MGATVDLDFGRFSYFRFLSTLFHNFRNIAIPSFPEIYFKLSLGL